MHLDLCEHKPMLDPSDYSLPNYWSSITSCNIMHYPEEGESGKDTLSMHQRGQYNYIEYMLLLHLYSYSALCIIYTHICEQVPKGAHTLFHIFCCLLSFLERNTFSKY